MKRVKFEFDERSLCDLEALRKQRLAIEPFIIPKSTESQMAKKSIDARPAEPMPAGTEEARHLNLLIESMETSTRHRVQCWCCSGVDGAEDTTEARFARDLYKSGWRFVSSEKFQTTGIVCPRCAKRMDTELGED